jgi:hypothetical protein
MFGCHWATDGIVNVSGAENGDTFFDGESAEPKAECSQCDQNKTQKPKLNVRQDCRTQYSNRRRGKSGGQAHVFEDEK